ncbi:DUF1127 domain-containing protein [Microvirga subterranea]|uniref:Uncharacterized protein DUF1127 n=1 Tax=Microvirga subterranea TaxID=186651 RepID=A0A370HLP9_9HYPH|nr:DUF1127 domain-containing protein [Microvirga subterranea]RDI59503.1 uncharacterized protein DUF1127 [Microvirga subterranea]
MSATMTTRTTARQHLAVRRDRSLLQRIVEVVAREFRVRRDMRALGSLDDAALHDIGLTRGSMEGALRYGRSVEQLRPAVDEAASAPLPRSLVEWR